MSTAPSSENENKESPPAPHQTENENKESSPTPHQTENEDKESSSTPHQPVSRSGHGWIWLLILLLIGGGYYFYHRRQVKSVKPAQTEAQPAVPVNVATVKKGDIGNYVTGLGAIVPLHTVTIRSRVDGQLLRVNYREGQIVNRGDLLAEIDPEPFQAQLTEAQGQYDRDQALLKNAFVDLDRYKMLYSKDAIPKQQLDTQVSTVHQYQGTVKNDQGLIDYAKTQLDYCYVRSPISGRVGLRLVDPGNIVHASDTTGMLVITQVEPISMIFSVAEDYLNQIAQQMKARQRLQVDALDRMQQNKIASGWLYALDNQVDSTTGTIRMRALFQNKQHLLFANQFVNAKLLINMIKGVPLIPASAIQRNGTDSYLFLVKPDQTIETRNVKVGAIDGDIAQVSGVKPGDMIAVDNFDKLQNGGKVAINKSSGDNSGRAGQ